MANAGEFATKTVLIAGAVLLVAVLGLGVFYLFGPREQVPAPDEREPHAEADGTERYGIITGVTRTGSEAEVIDSVTTGGGAVGDEDDAEGRRVPVPETLVLLDHHYDRAQETVSGSIMNNTHQPIVDVEIGLRLMNAQDEPVGEVRDTLSEIGPGETRRFSINLGMDEPVAQVVPVELTGRQRQVTGMQTDPKYPQNDYPNPRNEGGSSPGDSN